MSTEPDQLDLILAHQIARRAQTDDEREVLTFENGDQPDEVRSCAAKPGLDK